MIFRKEKPPANFGVVDPPDHAIRLQNQLMNSRPTKSVSRRLPSIMKPLIQAVLFLFIGIQYGLSQDSSVLISARMFDGSQKIALSARDGWLFKEGDDSSWRDKEINTAEWRRLRPTELSAKHADKRGRVEGWLRLKFRLDENLANIPLAVERGGWAATDVYLDGKLLARFGNTGEDYQTYKEYNPIDKPSLPVNLNLSTGTEHVLAMHLVDYLAPLSFGLLKSATLGHVRPKSQGLHSLLALTGPEYNSIMTSASRETLLYRTVWASVAVLLALLFWLLFFQNSGERQTVMLIALYASSSALSNLIRFVLTSPNISFFTYRINDLLSKLCTWGLFVLTFLIAKKILKFEVRRVVRLPLIGFAVLGALSVFFNFFSELLYSATIASFIFYVYLLVSFRKKLKGAQWAIAVGLSLSVLFAVAFSISNFTGAHFDHWPLVMGTGVYFSLPLSLLVYVSMRFKEIIDEVKEKAVRVIQITKEREEQALREKQIFHELLELEANALRAQMNPHFIYNCMNSIKALIQNDDKIQSIQYLTTFSKLIRKLFNNSDRRQISLYEEIETCRLYIELESMRLNGKLNYNFCIDPNLDTKSLMVPALIIQPFIENAIWHGVVPKDRGTINISVAGNIEAITCEVDDNGIGRERSRLGKPITPVIHESKGVRLSQQRLNLEKMLNDTNASIEIVDKYQDGIATGTRVILTFNLN